MRGAVLDRYERLIDQGRLKILLLCGHMRCGSSMLVHVLNTNPEITGYGETHYRYEEPRDFAVLGLMVSRAFRKWSLPDGYVMDKLTSDYMVNRDLLASDAVRVLFLVRHPEQSIPSH